MQGRKKQIYNIKNKREKQRITTQDRKKQIIIKRERKKQRIISQERSLGVQQLLIKSKYKTIVLKCDCLVVCNNNRRQINTTLKYYSDVILSLYMCL